MKKLFPSVIFVLAAALLVALTIRPTAQAQPPPPPPPPPVGGESLIINLPPSAINTPKVLRIETTNNFTFNPTSGQFEPASQNGFTVAVNQLSDINIPYYQIVITGFTKGGAAFLPGIDKVTAFNRLLSGISAKAYSPPPATNILCIAGYCRNPVYDVTLTFQDDVTKTDVNNLAGLLIGQPHAHAFLGDGNCNTGTTHLCLRPQIIADNFQNRTGSVFMLQAIERDIAGEIIVEGNVLGATTIGGFAFSNRDWVAVGGSITGITDAADNQKLNDYLAQTGSKLQWGSVSTPGTYAHRLNVLKEEGNTKSTEIETNSYGSPNGYTNLNLNSPNTSLSNPASSSFSSGPEGKLWKTTGTLTLTNVNFGGVGTIIVNGSLVINGDLRCATGTRLGVIATGSITFNSPTINCGAYTALGGSININGTVSGLQDAKGIFVARDTIDLPTVESGARYTIRYDTGFALDPSALFRNLLNIVFTTTS